MPEIADRAAEKRWLERARQGDDGAFAQLVEAYQRPVFNLCYRMLGDPQEAEDAAQETFLKAYRNLRRYDPQRSFTNWLLSIGSNHCIDRLRRRRLKLVPLAELVGGQATPAASESGDPEAQAIQREHRDRVQALLGQLGNRERAAIVLRYWYDLSYVEIAEALSMSASAAKSRLHRARKSLAQHWEAEFGWAVSSGGKQNEPSTI